MGDTGVEASGEGDRVSGAEPTGDKHNSSRSGVSMISMGNENFVSSVTIAAEGLGRGAPPAFPPVPPPPPPRELFKGGVGVVVDVVVVVAILVMGLDSLRGRILPPSPPEPGGDRHCEFVCGIVVGDAIVFLPCSCWCRCFVYSTFLFVKSLGEISLFVGLFWYVSDGSDCDNEGG